MHPASAENASRILLVASWRIVSHCILKKLESLKAAVLEANMMILLGLFRQESRGLRPRDRDIFVKSASH